MDQELELRLVKVVKEMGIEPTEHSCGEPAEYRDSHFEEALGALIDLFWKMQ